MALDLTVTQAQFATIKNALGAQLIMIYQPDQNDATKVGTVALLDAKMGHAVANWATASDVPTESDFLVSYPAAIRVEALIGSHE